MRFITTFKPKHYDIYLDLDRKEKRFSGQTTITGSALKKEVFLHQKNLTVTEVLVNGNVHPFKLDDQKDALIIELDNLGEAELKVSYSAKLTDTMMGIYPSYYTLDGQKKQLIGTQFETDAAREAFVCVDEPEAKATFSLAVKFDEEPSESIISNTPEVKVTDGVHYFEETPRMSTYLVCFVLGELRSKMTTTKSGVKVGVFSTKAHQAKELDFALDIAKRALEFYEEYYQTPYPLKHCWHVALPDFSAGAMENWGIITYREAYLLLDPDNTTLQVKQRVANVIAHELAHQWFGDLVTMKWWDDLWLNESFANMMEYVCIDHLEPTWNIWKTFQVSEVPLSLNRDALVGIQPIYSEVDDPAEIDALFDSAIVYAKGARMLVMVRALIGDKALRKGLKAYFKAHAYGNATGPELWEALATSSGYDLRSIMESWLKQPGYPVLKAKLLNDDLVLEQERFFIDKNATSEQTWPIPLMSNYPELPAVMDSKRLVIKNFKSMRANKQTALRLNQNNDAHYIVDYSPELLDDLLNSLTTSEDIARFAELLTLNLLAKAQDFSFNALLDLLFKYREDKNYLISFGANQTLSLLKEFVADNKHSKHDLATLVLDFIAPLEQALVADKISKTEASLIDPLLLEAKLYAKDKELVEKLTKLYHDTPEKVTLPAQVRGAVLKNMIENHNTSELFHAFVDAYQTTTDPSYKENLRQALTSSSEVSQLEFLIEHLKNADFIKPQDLRAWFNELLANPVSQKKTWTWLKENWNWLEETVGGDMEFTTYIAVIGRTLATKELYDEFVAFFDPKLDTPGLTREINLAKHLIHSRITLFENQSQVVKDELKTLAWYVAQKD